MKQALLALVLVAAVATSAGCSASGGAKTDSTKTSSGENAQEPSKSALAELKAETDGEKAALKAAAAEEGRKWATGNIQTGETAKGDPFLGGYVVTLNDGAKQYQILVLGGEVAPFFYADGKDMAIISAYSAGTNPTIEPQSERQEAAVAAAKKWLAKTTPGEMKGGIELYRCYFEEQEVRSTSGYPSVSIYADTTMGTVYSMGGPEVR